MSHNYKIVEEKENPLESIIEKDNITVKFSLIERDTKKREVEKKLRELKGQKSIDEASAKNVEDNHPHVLEATEDDIKKAHELVLYIKFQEDAKESEAYIKTLEEALEDWEEEMKEIVEQTGIELLQEINTEDLK